MAPSVHVPFYTETIQGPKRPSGSIGANEEEWMNMRNWENIWKVYRDFLPSLTAWYSLPENSRNKIRAEITHACAEVMRAEGDDPMSAPAVKAAQTEMIGKIGSLLGFPVAWVEAEKMLEGWAYYSADQERIQRGGKLFGPRIAQAVGDPVSRWWAEEYALRIGWLAADTLNRKAKAASTAAEKQAAEVETAARHEDIFRLITRLNQRYPCLRQEEDPKFAELKEEVKTPPWTTPPKAPRNGKHCSLRIKGCCISPRTPKTLLPRKAGKAEMTSMANDIVVLL